MYVVSLLLTSRPVFWNRAKGPRPERAYEGFVTGSYPLHLTLYPCALRFLSLHAIERDAASFRHALETIQESLAPLPLPEKEVPPFGLLFD